MSNLQEQKGFVSFLKKFTIDKPTAVEGLFLLRADLVECQTIWHLRTSETFQSKNDCLWWHFQI